MCSWGEGVRLFVVGEGARKKEKRKGGEIVENGDRGGRQLVHVPEPSRAA